ncbi:MAG TPA: serine protease [Terriglobales bacterium]|nr:serine protease [Terriglobales bacterium]
MRLRLRWQPSLRKLSSLPKFVVALVTLPLFHGTCPAAERPGPAATAANWAVPVLCTETQASARTKVRGTAVIVDVSGLILTAAHVVLQTNLFCTLTVLVPEGQWNNALRSHAFAVRQCATETSLDLALCHIEPTEHRKDWSYLHAAKLRQQLPPADSAVTITGFWGWGMLPLPRRGKLTAHMLYKRQDGVYCDFSTDVIGFEGMSGSPVVTDEGDLIGLITTAGIKQFSGHSFGISIERAAAFLRANGLPLPPQQH